VLGIDPVTNVVPLRRTVEGTAVSATMVFLRGSSNMDGGQAGGCAARGRRPCWLWLVPFTPQTPRLA
jgi:hypothetical protein